jgi:hypothetical protein
VKDGHVVSEARPVTRDELRRERNLGDEDDAPALRGAHLGDRAQVDLGLAGAGHSMEQEGRRRSRREGILDLTHGAGLGERRYGRSVAGRDVGEEGIRDALARLDPNEPERGEALRGGSRVAP